MGIIEVDETVAIFQLKRRRVVYGFLIFCFELSRTLSRKITDFSSVKFRFLCVPGRKSDYAIIYYSKKLGSHSAPKKRSNSFALGFFAEI